MLILNKFWEKWIFVGEKPSRVGWAAFPGPGEVLMGRAEFLRPDFATARRMDWHCRGPGRRRHGSRV